MNEIDMEYTITSQPLPPAAPFREIEALAVSADALTFGQGRAARVVLNWLDAVAPAKQGATDERE